MQARWEREGRQDPIEVALNLAEEDEDKAKAAPQSVRDISLIEDLDSEVGDGGFSQYFYESSGDHARETLAALERVGDTDRARLLREAMAVFGPQGPSPVEEKRNAQIEKFTETQDGKLTKLDDAWSDLTESLTVRLYGYALEHKEDFPVEEATSSVTR